MVDRLAQEINEVIRAGLRERDVIVDEPGPFTLLKWRSGQWVALEFAPTVVPSHITLQSSSLIVFEHPRNVEPIMTQLIPPFGGPSSEVFPKPGSTGYMLSGTEGWIRVTVLDVSEFVGGVGERAVPSVLGRGRVTRAGIERIKVRWEEGKHKGDERWVPANYVQAQPGGHRR